MCKIERSKFMLMDIVVNIVRESEQDGVMVEDNPFFLNEILIPIPIYTAMTSILFIVPRFKLSPVKYLYF